MTRRVEKSNHLSVVNEPIRADVLRDAACFAAGYVCISTIPLTDHAWNLYWICVHPREQGHGLGRVLIEAAEAHARAQGGHLLVLETSGRPAYDHTRRFYQACGWTEEARIRDFYRPGDDVVYYVRRLV